MADQHQQTATGGTATATVSGQRRFSIVWFIPIVAALIGAEQTDRTVDPAVADKITASLRALLPDLQADDIRATPIENLYEVSIGMRVVYVTGDGRYLLQGDLIDLETQVNLSEASRTDSRRDLMAKLGDDEVIVFSPEEVKYSVSVFTDVDCTYCRRLHSQIEQYMANGIEVRYLLYPRGGPASAAWNTSEAVWCAKDRGEALTAAKLDREFESSSCDASAVQDHYILGQEVGLSGTPAIVLDDGELIAGYLPPDALKVRLEQKAAAPEQVSASQ